MTIHTIFFFFKEKGHHSLGAYYLVITLSVLHITFQILVVIFNSFQEKKKSHQGGDPQNYCHQPSAPCISSNILPMGHQKREGSLWMVVEWRWAQEEPGGQFLRACGVGVRH